MEAIYFIAKIIVASICVISSLLLLYLSVKARVFLVSLKELENLLTKDIRKFMIGGSVAINALVPLLFRSGKAKSPLALITFIIDMVKTRCKS